MIDRCVWHLRLYVVRDSLICSILPNLRQRRTESIFLPFMCRLRFLEIYMDLRIGTTFDFRILSLLMASLCTSVTSSATLEHMQFNIQFRDRMNDFNFHSFYMDLRVADTWRHLDSITTHPAGSRLQRVDINLDYAFRYDEDGAELDKDEVFKAVLDALPLLRTKGILFVKTVVETELDSL